MKKRSKPTFGRVLNTLFLMAFINLLFTATIKAQNYESSGAGVAYGNGLWLYTGTFNDRPSFVNYVDLYGDGSSMYEVYMFYIYLGDYEVWAWVMSFERHSDYNPLYLSVTDSSTPPADWSLREDLEWGDPPPTVAVAKTQNLTSTLGFRLLSSPVEASYAAFFANAWTQGATGGNSTHGQNNVWTWNNNATDGLASNWTGVTNLSNTVNGANAFLYYHFDDRDFNGRDNASAMIWVRGEEKSAPGTVSLNSNANGWSLIGNPFATSIGWNLVTGKTNIQADARIWNPTADNTGNWATISGSDIITPFQGFFVQTTSNGAASLTISSDAKTSGGTFYGKGVSELHEIVFQFKNGAMLSEPRARMHADASFGRDAYDGDRMVPMSATYLDAYFTSNDGRAHSNNAIPTLTQAYEMPLYVEMTQTGSVTITVSKNTFPAHVNVELLDVKTGAKTRINGDFSYTFEHVKASKVRPDAEILKSPVTMAANETALRFKLILTPDAATSNENSGAVKAFALEQNYPNPFNPMTAISFSTPATGNVTLTVMNMLGQTVATVTDGVLPAGRHTVNFDASKLASGVYLYRLQAGNQVQIRKMSLLK